ncbi:hypothetical protein E4T56_gene5241 [Termitomyces sp. T112]|nr:hypothetical protein E4T56_gene5241 [Termitomyces sp. T112]
MSSEAAVSVEEFATLRESHTQLYTMMSELLTTISSMSNAAAPLHTPTAPQHAVPVSPPQTISPFVPPILGAGTNGASSASLSLRTQFPDVDVAVITAIITHEFKAADLHKLDPTNRDKETAYTFKGSTNQFEVSHRAAKEYKTPFTVLIPLQTYFDILAFHVNNAAATGAFYRYTAHLLKLIAEYEWSAVYDYHAIFFNRRRAEIAAGDYSQWGRRNNDLLSEHVHGHRKVNPTKHTKGPSGNRAPGNPSDRSVSQDCVNLKSATTNPITVDTLSSDIAAQVASGRMRGPFDLAPFPNFCASPIGAVAHKQSLKIRRIHHLSWPEGSSVNDGIPDSEASIIYDLVDCAVRDLIASGLGSLMLKLNLELAFCHIPVCIEDWLLLGFEWLGKLYFDVVLAFGARSAPYIFNLFAEALHWILQRNIPARIRHYLDNFLGIFAPSTLLSLVRSSLSWAQTLAGHLGLTFQPSKIVGPDTSIEYLGLELDSIKMEICLPQDKLAYLQELMATWSQRRRCTLHDLDELTGFLQFTSQVIPMARAFLRGLYDLATAFPKTPFTSRHITKTACRDIQWWATIAPDWNGIRIITPMRKTANIFTDASGAKGLGGHFGTEWFAARCPHRLRHEHIQVKEMFAVIYAILCWGESLWGLHVIFHVDNEAVFNAIHDKTIRSKPTMKLVQLLIALACRIDFSFSSEWLSSTENSVADAASHFSFSHMFTIAPWLNKKPSLKHLQTGGFSKTDTIPHLLPFIFGMDSQPAPDARTQPAKGNLFSTYSSTIYTMPTDQSSPPLSSPSSLGLRASAAEFNPRQSKPTWPQSAHFMLTPTSPSPQSSHPLCNASSAALNATMASETTGQSSPSLCPSSLPSWQVSSQALHQDTRQSTQRAALPTQDYSAVASSHAVQFVPSFEHATHIRLTLPASKTDPFRKGVTIIIAAAPGQPTCPVAVLKALFTKLPRDDNAPLFEQLDGKALSYNFFVKSIREALSLAGFNPGSFVGHSFRRGAASAAAAAGYSNYEIQLLGRWRSDSYKLYIDSNPVCILHLSSLLHLAHTHLAPFEPLALRDYTAMA